MDNASRHESNSALIGFPRRCLHTTNRPVAAGEKHKCDKLVGLLGDEGEKRHLDGFLVDSGISASADLIEELELTVF